MTDKILKKEEKVIFALRELYSKYGYLPYRMSKFEEYELYIRNKEFMVSDRVIAFNDTNGKLLALKPDVTLSIIKSGEDLEGVTQKVYYNENVYRVSKSTHRYKEIMQAGLECIGDIDLYDIYEVILLGVLSLAQISENFVLCISHLGIIGSVIGEICPDTDFIKQAISLISQKNTHDLRKLCIEYNIPNEAYEKLCVLLRAYGKADKVLPLLKSVSDCKETKELEKLSALLEKCEYADKILFDFSLADDINYYNGFIFKGFIDGISAEVLSGGQYDKMMRKMNRSSGALGFALYLDMLEQLNLPYAGYDVDYLLLHDDSVPFETVAGKVKELVEKGFTCSTQRGIPEKLKYKEIIDLRGGRDA